MINATTDKEINIFFNGGLITTEEVGEKFILCEASKLSLEDEFMKYEPRNDNEAHFKNELEKAIRSGGLKDFYRPKYDPSFDSDGRICFIRGAKPAVGKSYSWWEEHARYYWNGRSRLGRKDEYLAFLGILIKKLSSTGWHMDAAWHVICNDSSVVGHYIDSPNAKRKNFEPTGSRKFVDFYDLANTFKILSDDAGTGGFWNECGAYYCNSGDTPLAQMDKYYSYEDENNYGVGWIILPR